MSNEELKEALMRALAGVRDPQTGKDLLSAGLIEEIEIDAPDVRLAVTLADSPAPRQMQVRAGLEQALRLIPGIERVAVEFVRESTEGSGPGHAHAHPHAHPHAPAQAQAAGAPPPSSAGPRKLPMAGGGPAGKTGSGSAAGHGHGQGQAHGQGVAGRQTISGVKHIVAVASGKGGVGKSTVCVNLALALRHLGARVGLMDADIYGPSIPLMMGVNRRPSAGPDGKILPLTAYGLKVMSLGFLMDEATPVIWRGPMVQGVVRQFLLDVNWGELDYLMIDLPPGTGDAQLTLVQSVALSGAIIVTTPSDLALIDAAKGLNMFRTVEVPIFGIIENMSYFHCPHCNERSDIFSSKGGQRVAEKLDAPFLGEIPLEGSIRKGGDEGRPIVVGAPDSPQAKPFFDLARNLRARLEGLDEGRAGKREADKKSFFGALFSRP